MIATGKARDRLRAATAPHHRRVDAIFSPVPLSDAGAYGAFLRAQAAAHIPVEEALTVGGVAALVPDWAARQRSGLLADDLRTLGLAPPSAVATIRLDGDAALLGALYVLEGSRLGGALLARSVGEGLPRNFLAKGDSAAWRRLLDLLDARLRQEVEQRAAIAAAAKVFNLFEAAGRRHLPVKPA